MDLAKNVFELVAADDSWNVVERSRLTRTRFQRWFHNRDISLVVMEACGSTHHWGRVLQQQGIQVKLLPPRYVRAWVKRNKTDAGDAAALLEAVRCADTVRPLLENVAGRSQRPLAAASGGRDLTLRENSCRGKRLDPACSAEWNCSTRDESMEARE